MKLEWDDIKARSNLYKHGVSFEEAQTAAEHLLAITVNDLAHSDIEDREKTIGLPARGRVLVVAHAKPAGGMVCIISARKANRHEVSDYDEEIRQRLAQE